MNGGGSSDGCRSFFFVFFLDSQTQKNWWKSWFRLTVQQVGAAVRRTVCPKQQPVKVVLLPLREVAQVGVRIVFERAAHS